MSCISMKEVESSEVSIQGVWNLFLYCLSSDQIDGQIIMRRLKCVEYKFYIVVLFDPGLFKR